MIFLSNLGEAPTFDPQSMARGVAGRYIPALLLSFLKGQPDTEPQLTENMQKVLSEIANNVQDSLLMTPALNVSLPSLQWEIGPWIKDLKSFTFVACEEVGEHPRERYGVPVSRICYYKAVHPVETRYFEFYLTAHGRVADLWSSSE